MSKSKAQTATLAFYLVWSATTFQFVTVQAPSYSAAKRLVK